MAAPSPLGDVHQRLLEEIVQQPHGVKRFRITHEAHRQSINELLEMRLIADRSGMYFPTLAGLIYSSGSRAKAALRELENIHQALLLHYRTDPDTPITTTAISKVVKSQNARINYLIKTFSDGIVPGITGSGTYAEGDGDSSFGIPESILDYKSFDDVIRYVKESIQQSLQRRQAAVAPKAQSPERETASKWRWKEKIAEGGQGETFKVIDAQGNIYAGKRLKNKSRMSRFLREITALAAIEHPNVLRIVDSDLTVDKPFIITEYCVGRDLDQNRCWLGHMPAKLQIIREVARGLAAAHDAGIVHRDIKPANILLKNATWHTVIADFGICYLKESEDLRQTSTMEVIGPRWFIAPEYEAGFVDSPSPESDIYSLGKLLYWLLSDGRIFPRELHRDPRYDLSKSIHPSYENLNWLLDKVLAHDPKARVSSAAGFLAELESLEDVLSMRPNSPRAESGHKCIYCRVGIYEEIENSIVNVDLLVPGKLGNADVKMMSCKMCGNIQMFWEAVE